MSAVALETFLARLYTDTALREAFSAHPESVARAAGLDELTAKRLAGIDLQGLALAADSFAHKRAAHAGKRARAGTVARLKGWLRW